MFKIREDFNLKELEKYKFVFDNWINVYEQNEFTGLRVEPISRKIGIYNSADIIVEKETMDTLYDLIKADIVVKG